MSFEIPADWADAVQRLREGAENERLPQETA